MTFISYSTSTHRTHPSPIFDTIIIAQKIHFVNHIILTKVLKCKKIYDIK